MVSSKKANFYTCLSLLSFLILILLLLFYKYPRTITTQNQYTYPIKQEANITFHFDLDGDHKAEKILYDNSKRLYINEKEYADYLDHMKLSEPIDSFYLFDIDSSDSYVEIGISTYGPSDDLMTYFYHYDKGQFIELGRLEGFPDQEADIRVIEKVSDSVIKAPLRLSILQTWWGYQYYDLEHHKLISREQTYYVPTCTYHSKLLLPVTLYEDPDLASSKKELSLQTVEFILTDNKSWCKIKTEDEHEGWIYIDEMGRLDGKEATAVFADLALYD